MCGTQSNDRLEDQDVEKDAGTDEHLNEKTSFPTRMDIFYDLNGSLGFAIGSSGFILSMYFSNWLPYFRYGSLAWIWGCVFYSIPILLKLKQSRDTTASYSCPWGIGDLGELLCYLFYTIGCVLGGFFDADTVEQFLPVINHTFLYGSFSLVLEPVYRVLLFLRKIFSTSPTNKSNDTNNVDNNTTTERSVSPMNEFNWDRCLELSATFFFCAAGVFGGFAPHPSLALLGVYFWEVGSCFSVARSFFMIHKRNQGLQNEKALL